MKPLDSLRKGIDFVLSFLCSLLFAAMVVIGTYQIMARFIFRSPSTVSEELFDILLYLDGAFGRRMRFWKKRAYAHEFSRRPSPCSRPESLVYRVRNSGLASGRHCDGLRRFFNCASDYDTIYSFSWNTDGHGLYHSSHLRHIDCALFCLKYHRSDPRRRKCDAKSKNRKIQEGSVKKFMDTAIICGLIILTVLILLLLAGVPIAAALGISSICAILP